MEKKFLMMKQNQTLSLAFGGEGNSAFINDPSMLGSVTKPIKG